MYFNIIFSFIVIYYGTVANCDRLILSSLIKSNKIDEAKNLSYVRNLPNAPKFESYSGFFTVDEKYNSNMFFWFFPSLKNPKTAPIIVYVEGGPGTSSVFSLFLYGPIKIDSNMNVTINPLGWTQEFSMLYIDNPVGTGFSFTNSTDGLSSNENTIADHLYEVIQQFYTVFHEYRDNELYIAGQSYAGKYIPALGYKLMQMSNTSKINFKGVAIGNGLTDPINQINYSALLKGLGLIDEKELTQMRELEENIRKQIKAGDYLKALDYYNELLLGKPNVSSLVSQLTGSTNNYNFLKTTFLLDSYGNATYFTSYLNQNNTRKALHVGDLHYEINSAQVYIKLREDMMKSVEPNLTALIGKYKVLLFVGNLDIICGVSSVNGLLENRDWKYYNEFYHANKTVWKVNKNDSEVAGYAKSFGNFTYVLIRNSSHGTIHDQPRATFDMIKRFISSKSFTN